jgi:hypothetical protein
VRDALGTLALVSRTVSFPSVRTMSSSYVSRRELIR